jgi:polyhydroxybutyrate depolymerase
VSRRRATLLGCSALLMAGCSTSSGSSGAPDASGPSCPAGLTAKPGETTETIMVGGIARTYILHVPPSYTGKTAMPLVFDFHPIGVDASLWKYVAGWGTAADSQGFVVVWPQGYGSSWNVGRCCPPALDAGVDDVAFTRAMIDQISSEACIDSKRVYASGCSNGGGMSYKLACDAADVIAAVAPVDFDCITGPTNDPSCGDCNPSRPITEVQFRTPTDQFCPYDGGPTSVVAGLLFPGAKANFATWAGIDQCTGSPQADPSQPACDTYEKCAGGAQATLCSVPNGTHCGYYTTFPVVDTAYSAFQAHPLP